MPSSVPDPNAKAHRLIDAGGQAAKDIRNATLVKGRDLFLLADLEGNVPVANANGLGLYHHDVRFLNTFDLAVQGLRPTILLSSGRWHFLGTYVLTNPDLVTDQGEIVHKETIQIRRYRTVRGRHLSESLTFQNFNSFAVDLEIALHIDADFADMFDVRGFVTTETRKRTVSCVYAPDAATFACTGRDGVFRSTHIRFGPAPSDLGDGVARYRLHLPTRGEQRIAIEIEISEEALPESGARAPSGTTARENWQWLDGTVTVQTSNAGLNAVLDQARNDLRALLTRDVDSKYIAAGIPWYAALFGRDSLITAIQHLWLSPILASHTLRLLARRQAQSDDPWRDAEPGKILHESRRGDLARAGLVPFSPYFGTVDATPLWIILLAEYHRATGDLALVRELMPNLEAALTWIDRYGDSDGDGFVEYRTRSPSGLVNQGWKDSWDAIVHSDGSLAEPPIALVEVQGYVYAAKRGAAALFRATGQPDRARCLDSEATSLRSAFEQAFWMPSEGFYCLALDGRKKQVASITSNPGQALWTGIVSSERAAGVAARLMSEDLYSGWGIRTLSSRESRYNPVGYHIGTVWPHDNALIALGMKRYGLEANALDLMSGLFDASQHFPSNRMPELFCGFARSAFGLPVRYPVACNPQAWAVTSWSMLLQAMLGVLPDASTHELSVVQPTLPSWLQWVEVDHIRVGAAEVDLRYERVGDRTAVDVVAMRGDVRVALAGRWPV